LSGLAFGIPGAALTGALGYEINIVMTAGAIIAGVSASVSWLWKFGLQDDLLWLVEKVTRRDLTGDGNIGKPQLVDPVRLEVVTEPAPGKFNGLNIDLPAGVDRGLFAHWASMVVSGQMPTGRTHWTGAGRPFSRELYDRFLIALETAGIIRDAGDGKGRVLTAGGRHSLQRFLRTAEPIPPAG
jgi:hypothetical protein